MMRKKKMVVADCVTVKLGCSVSNDSQKCCEELLLLDCNRVSSPSLPPAAAAGRMRMKD